jgi:hypothetical protein
VRRAIVAAVVSLLFVAEIASAQTTGTAPGAAGPFSISAEALLWWFKGNATPPLVSDGLLGEPGTKVLLGGEDLDTNPNPGFRVTAAYALNERWGVEGSFLYVPTRSTSRSVSSSGQLGSTDLFIPFVDVTLPGESVTELSATGFFSGQAREELRNSLLGAELNATMRLPTRGPVRVDALGGFRYLRLRETYTFSTDSPNIPPQPADVFTTRDEFDATNNFFGLQVGARARVDWGALFLSGALKVALGAMVESVDIDGRLVTNDFNNFGAPETFAGGYFAQPTNMGNHTRSVFAVVPEAGLTLGYQITPRLSVFGGYTFLYASNVVRAPQQLNRNINPAQAPAITGDPPAPLTGPAQPSFRFKSSDFWAQGLNVGIAFRF